MKLKKFLTLSLGLGLLFSPLPGKGTDHFPLELERVYAAEVDYSNLKRAVEDADNVYNSQVFAGATQEKKASYTAAIEDGRSLLSSGRANQSQVNAMVLRINSAKNSLVNESTVSRGALYKKIEEGKSYLAGQYTKTSKNNLIRAINDGIDVYNQKNLPSADYKKASANIDQAIKGLSKDGKRQEQLAALKKSREDLGYSLEGLKQIQNFAPKIVKKNQKKFNEILQNLNERIRVTDKAIAQLSK